MLKHYVPRKSHSTAMVCTQYNLFRVTIPFKVVVFLGTGLLISDPERKVTLLIKGERSQSSRTSGEISLLILQETNNKGLLSNQRRYESRTRHLQIALYSERDVKAQFLVPSGCSAVVTPQVCIT